MSAPTSFQDRHGRPVLAVFGRDGSVIGYRRADRPGAAMSPTQDGAYPFPPDPAPSWPPASWQLAAFRRDIDSHARARAVLHRPGADAGELARGIGAQDADLIGLPIGGGWLEIEAGPMWAALLDSGARMRQDAAAVLELEAHFASIEAHPFEPDADVPECCHACGLTLHAELPGNRKAHAFEPCDRCGSAVPAEAHQLDCPNR
jgi:hypothetical protein